MALGRQWMNTDKDLKREALMAEENKYMNVNDSQAVLDKLGLFLLHDIKRRENAMHRVNEINYGPDNFWNEVMREYPHFNYVVSEPERKRAFLSNTSDSTIFPVNWNPYATDEMPWYERSEFSTVGRYDSVIEEAAKMKEIDPDILRAIMYIETTHGFYEHCLNNFYTDAVMRGEEIEGVGKLFFPGLKSFQPMNINHRYWGNSFGTIENLKKPTYNILVAAEFVKRLSKFVGNSGDIERIATLYNHLGAQQISDYGKRVGKIYRQKLWKHPEQVQNRGNESLHKILDWLLILYCSPGNL